MADKVEQCPNCRKLESALAQIRTLASDETTTDPDAVLESIVQICEAVARMWEERAK